jgi:hypothetical protein
MFGCDVNTLVRTSLVGTLWTVEPREASRALSFPWRHATLCVTCD